MQDIWNNDPESWKQLSLLSRLHAMRIWYCTGPCGQSQRVMGTREALSKSLIDAQREILKANQFRDEVMAALINCQDHDRLRKRLMELIEMTAKPQRAD